MTTLKQKTKAIQEAMLEEGIKLPKYGADGGFGHEMADGLIEHFGVQPEQERASDGTGLVKGTGKNIKKIFIHCTATREGQHFDVEAIRRMHLRMGWSDIGYHFLIEIDGDVARGRPEHRVGSHVRGYNTGSIGVVYVGGLDASGKPKDTRTPEQTASMARLVSELLKAYPGAEVLGHRDASPDKNGDGKITPNEFIKACPCFDVKAWWSGEAG